jgi:hypothetical protein
MDEQKHYRVSVSSVFVFVISFEVTRILYSFYTKLRDSDSYYIKAMWRRTEKISWTGRVRKEEILHRVKEDRNILHAINKERLTGLVTCCVGTAF